MTPAPPALWLTEIVDRLTVEAPALGSSCRPATPRASASAPTPLHTLRRLKPDIPHFSSRIDFHSHRRRARSVPLIRGSRPESSQISEILRNENPSGPRRAGVAGYTTISFVGESSRDATRVVRPVPNYPERQERGYFGLSVGSCRRDLEWVIRGGGVATRRWIREVGDLIAGPTRTTLPPQLSHPAQWSGALG
jgi:hypothetical protein